MSFRFVIYIFDISEKSYTKLIYHSPKQVPVMMDKECNHYVKVCFKKAELIYKRFYHIVFLEIYKSFNLIPEQLEAKKRFCVEVRQKNSRRNGIQVCVR